MSEEGKMNILVTGATGFVGSKLAEHLVVEEGSYKVYGLVRDDSFRDNLVEGVIPLKGDLTDRRSLDKAIEMSQPEIVIHTAAYTPVRFSFGDPFPYSRINYEGTVNLIQAIVDSGMKVRQFIHSSSMEVYQPKEGLILETDCLNGSTPYGISKMAADFYVQMARLAYDLPTTILRGSNTFGRPIPNLPPEAGGYLVEKTILQMLNPDTTIAEFNGHPWNKRTWLYAPDHVSGYLTVFDNPKAVGEIFNISQNNCTSVGGVLKIIADLTGFGGTIKWGVKPRPYDPLNLCADGRKLMKLGWKAKYNLEEGLKETIEGLRGMVEK